jgi:beta-glucanase (GH16 family)
VKKFNKRKSGIKKSFIIALGIAFLFIILIITVVVSQRQQILATHAEVLNQNVDPASPANVQPNGQTSGWHLVFSDEFNQNSLNLTKWIMCNPSFASSCNPFNNEQEKFNVAQTNNSNVVESGGLLHLITTKQNGQIWSGMVSTGPNVFNYNQPSYQSFQYTYGYYEGRVKIPKGDGFWPSLWELPDQNKYGPWPGSGEYDNFEIPGNNPTDYHFTAHWGGTGGACGHPCSPQEATIPDASAAYHTFGLDWEPTGLTWYVDGKKMGNTITDAGAIQNHPFYIIANLSVGGNWGPLNGAPDASTPFPAEMDIDYLRVWQKGAGSTATNPPVSPPPPTAITPTFNCLANACPTLATSQSPTAAVSPTAANPGPSTPGTTIVSPSGATSPSSPPTNSSPSTPCPTTQQSVSSLSTANSHALQSGGKIHSFAKQGLFQQFFQFLLQFLLQLLQLIFQQLGLQLPGLPSIGTSPCPTSGAAPSSPNTSPLPSQSVSSAPSQSIPLPTPTIFGAPTTSLPAPTTQGFYVATNGNDNNAGTLQSPFVTLGKCQSAMEASSTIKTCYIRAGTYKMQQSAGTGCSASSEALLLADSDKGETWSFYPPDGYDSAIIDGGASGSNNGLDTGICIQTSNVTIDGLQLQHFGSNFIHVLGGPNATITNNIVHDSYDQPFVAAIKMDTLSQGAHVTHNVVYNVASNGISSHSCNGGYGGCAQGISNDVIAYNVVYNYCEDDYDCGAIEFQDYDSPSSTNILAAYNYVRDGDLVGPGAPQNDGGGIGGGRALYMDDGTSNVTYKGNIITGKNEYCVQIHGGANDIFKNNICDLQPPASNQTIGNDGMSITYLQNSSHVAANYMTNNHSDNNIIIGNDPNGGNGYDGDGTAPSKLEISNSAYHNYASGPSGSCDVGGINDCGAGGTDSSPQSISTLFNPCPTDGADSWSFELESSSPALSSPISFPQSASDTGVAWGRPGFWGPPGYKIPHTGNPPSYKPC